MNPVARTGLVNVTLPHWFQPVLRLFKRSPKTPKHVYLNDQGPKDRYVPPAEVSNPALAQTPASPPPSKKEFDHAKYERDKKRNERLTIMDRITNYVGFDPMIMRGMFSQRLDGDDAPQSPFYNPDGAGISLGGVHSLHDLNQLLLTKAGQVFRWLFGPDNYDSFIKSTEARAEQNATGDFWYGLGNGLRLIGGLAFSAMFKEEGGLKKAILKYFLAPFTKILPTKLSQQILQDVENLNANPADKALFRKALKHIPLTYLMAMGFLLISPVALPIYGSWRFMNDPAKTMQQATRSMQSAALKTGSILSWPIRQTYSMLKDLTLWLVFFRTNRAERLAHPEKYLSTTELESWRTIGERILNASTIQEKAKAHADKLILSGILMTASANIETALAKGQSKRLLLKSIEKGSKMLAPTANALMGTGLALPILGLAHLSILNAVSPTVSGNIPKILRDIRKPYRANTTKEYLSSVGFYIGFGIQSAYALGLGAYEFAKQLSGSEVALKDMYDHLLQAKHNLPEGLAMATLGIMIAPQLVSLTMESAHMYGILKNPEPDKKKIRIAHTAVGGMAALCGIAGALYMSNTQLYPLATGFTASFSLLIAIQTFIKNRFRLEESAPKNSIH